MTMTREGRSPVTSDAEELVRQAIASANAGDTEGFLACFEAEGCVDDWGTRYVGREQITQWSDREFIGVDVSLDVTEWRVSGPTVSILAAVGGSGFNGPSHFTFTVPEQLVRLLEIRA
jgi:hypothetical protein